MIKRTSIVVAVLLLLTAAFAQSVLLAQNFCSNTQVRVTFKGRVSGTAIGMQLDHAAICLQSTSYNCATPPVELTFSGAHGFSIAAGASITSDWVSLPVSPLQQGAVYTQTLSTTGATWSGVSLRNILPVAGGGAAAIVIMDWTTGANNSDAAFACSGTNGYSLAATASYNQAAPAGVWTTVSACEGIAIIEVRPSSLPPSFVFGPLDLLGNAGNFTSGNYTVSTNYVSTSTPTLVQSFDYSQRVYYNPASLQSNIVIQQNWPAQPGGQVLRGYPEVQYTPTPLIAVNALATFTVAYTTAIAGALQDYQLAFDFFGWPTSTLNSGTPVFELLLSIYVPAAFGHTSNQSFNIDGIGPCTGSQVFYEVRTTPIISVTCVAADSQAALSGTMDFKAILASMQSHGLITGSEFVGNVQLGTELRQNTSNVHIDRFIPTVN